MSFTVQPPPRRPRPGVVSGSRTLLYVAAALVLAYAGLTVFTGLELRGVTAPQGTPEEQQAAETISTVTVVIEAAIQVLLAGGFAVLAVLTGQGKQPARVVTWVLGGMTVLCCGCGLIGNAFMDQLLTQMGGGENLVEEINAALPGWVGPVTVVLSLSIVLALGAAVILLALPAANDFFRAEQEVWVAPTYPTDSGMGGYPGSSSYPGFPSYPGSPGYPPEAPPGGQTPGGQPPVP